MRIIKYTALFCLLAIQTVSSQSVINLNAPLTGTQTKTARDAVVMNTGFVYTAKIGETFIANINKTLVGDANYSGVSLSSTVFNSNESPRNLDKSLSVGSLEGSLNISSTGAASYTIPISVPQGINGMQPTVALVYSSQSGNGILGVGWNLSCLSTISRTGNTIYHEGFSSNIMFTDDDPLLMDGKHLICINDPTKKGLAGSEFRFEVDDNTIVTKSGDGFIVKTTDGKTIEYGLSADAKLIIKRGGVETTVSWLLNKITDANGLTINYQYITDSNKGEVYISSITYSDKKIQFLYADRIDSWTGNLYGSSWSDAPKVSQSVLLEKIELYSNNSLFGSYSIKYINENNISQLSEVTQTNKEGKSVNATVFKWNYKSFGLNQVAQTTIPGFNQYNIEKTFTGDFNGDGFMDLIVHRKIQHTDPYFANYMGYDINCIIGKVTDHSLEFYKGGVNGLIYVSASDFPSAKILNNEDELYNIAEQEIRLVLSSNPNKLGINYIEPDYYYHLTKYMEDVVMVDAGDFNGDGKPEIIIGIKEYSPISSNRIVDAFCDIALCQYESEWGTCDANIDATDYLTSNGYSYYVYSIANNIITQYATNNSDGSNFTSPTSYCFDAASIDYNQDGKADLRARSGANYARYFTMNDQFSGFAEIASVDAYVEKYKHRFLSLDINGDGLTDYVNNTVPAINPLVFSADQFVEQFSTHPAVLYIKNPSGDNYQSITLDKVVVGVTDYNGDGISELICVKPNLEHYHNLLPYLVEYYTKDIETKCVFIKKIHSIYPIYDLAFVRSYKFTIENYNSIYTGIPLKEFPNIYSPMPLVRSCDIDQDGMQDLMYLSPFEMSNDIYYSLKVYLNKKDLTYEEINTGVTVGSGFQVADFNGDGNPDIFEASNAGITRHYASDMPGYRISEIIDGNNNRTVLNYKPLTDQTVFEKENNYKPNYPLASLHGSMGVVAKVKSSMSLKDENGNERWDSIQYTYKNLMYHMLGKGVLGFEKFIVSSTSHNKRTIQIHESLQPFCSLAVKELRTETMLGAPISSVVNTNIINSLGGKRYQLHIPQTVETDNLTGVVTKILNEYDLSTGIVEKTSVYYGEENEVTKIINPTYTIISGTTNFYKPSAVEKTIIYKNQPAFEQKQTFTYDNKGNLLTQVDFANTDKPVTTTYSNYNSLGIPLTVQKSASGVETAQSTITVDNQGRVLSSTNALGFTSFKTYDPIFGNVLTEKDHLGNIVKYTYDAWGKIVSSISPTGINKYSTTNWATDGNQPTNALYKVTASGDGNPNVITYYDARGRELQIISYNAFNQKIVADKEYDAKGRVAATSEPRFESETPRWTSYTYDDYGRQSTIVSPTSMASVNYNGLTINSIVNGRTSSKTLNAIGDVLSATDAMGNTVSYTYHSSGQPVTITAAGATTTMAYNAKGQQTQLIDPDAGTTQYEYDAFGRLEKQTDARGYEFSMTYDVGGRPLTKICPNNITLSYAYSANGLTDYILSTQTGQGYHKKSFTYDTQGRMLTKTDELASGETYTSSYMYDNYNRVIQKTYPSGYQIKYAFSDINGQLTKILKSNNAPIWELQAENSKGQATQFKWGNTIQSDNTFSENGFLTQQTTGNIYQMRYTYDETKGNLLYRYDTKTGQQESFRYDALDRLEGISPDADDEQLITYASNGNITYKYDAGTYEYNDAAHPHAVTAVTGNTTIPSFAQTITYNAFGKVATINEDVNNMSIRYGTDQQRIEGKWYNNGTLVKTKKYLGDYEIKIQGGVTNYYHYIYTPSGLTAVMIRTGSTDSLFYVCTDHLGSITALVTEGGTVVERHSFDAWGRERNPNNWSEYVTTYNRLERGYTMHEHLYTFGLINMNGRVYDPILGRMLSPDNYVQDTFNPQNYNRYGYCLNNPLIYIDPSGEKVSKNIWKWLAYSAIADVFTGGLISSTASIMAVSAVATYIPLSNEFYEMQKLISPLAVKANLNFGSDKNEIGFDVSMGAPTICPIGARAHAGWSYYSSYYDDSYTGFAGRYGYELFAGDGVGDNLSYSVTNWDMKGTTLDQSTIKVKYGNALFNIEYENDYMFGLPGEDGGDRWRTGAARINMGGCTYGVNLFTGDPGPKEVRKKFVTNINGQDFYNYEHVNDYRAGIAYAGFGPIQVGWNSEDIRYYIQNEKIHSQTEDPYHPYVDGKPNRLYWSIGTGSGDTLW